MSQQELSPEALTAIDKVAKLLAVAKSSTHEGEIANAMSLAMKILEDYGLDMALVERRKGEGGAPAHSARQDTAKGGGLYKWQRKVWKDVAELNSCVYFSIRGLARGSKYENRLVGRTENVLGRRALGRQLPLCLGHEAR